MFGCGPCTASASPFHVFFLKKLLDFSPRTHWKPRKSDLYSERPEITAQKNGARYLNNNRYWMPTDDGDVHLSFTLYQVPQSLKLAYAHEFPNMTFPHPIEGIPCTGTILDVMDKMMLNLDWFGGEEWRLIVFMIRWLTNQRFYQPNFYIWHWQRDI